MASDVNANQKMADDAVRDAFEAEAARCCIDLKRPENAEARIAQHFWLAAHEHARAQMEAQLRHQGLCIVPIQSTRAMNEAAAQAMRVLKERVGADWTYATNKQKAAIRWAAMLEACRPTLAEPQPTGAGEG